MKNDDRSCKQSHKFDGIRVGRNRTFPFLPIPCISPSLTIQWKQDCRRLKQKPKNQPITRPTNIMIGLVYSSVSAYDSNNLVFATVWAGRSHKRNGSSASDSVSLIFTRSCRSTLLITTPSLVKPRLQSPLAILRIVLCLWMSMKIFLCRH